MDEITLATINNSITQLNNRIADTNSAVVLLRTENIEAHRDLTKKINVACSIISELNSQSSVTTTKLDSHLDEHKKKENRSSINGVNITALVGTMIASMIGAITTLKVAGMI